MKLEMQLRVFWRERKRGWIEVCSEMQPKREGKGEMQSWRE